MNRSLILFLFAATSLLTFSERASAQAMPAAGGDGGILAVGFAFSTANSDYAPQRITGLTGYATYRLTRHFEAEADVRFLTLGTPNDFGERTYMGGLRYVYRRGRLEPYIKGLAGLGQTVAQEPFVIQNAVPSKNFASALGGGLDIRFPKRITVRAIDFEYQDWPNFDSNFGGNGLTPKVFSFGVAYRIR